MRRLGRYVVRRRLLPVAPWLARAQLVELAFHEDRDVAHLAVVELLDRLGHEEIEIEEVAERKIVCRVYQRSWLNMVMPRLHLVEWRVRVRSACRRRWSRVSTRVPPLLPTGLLT